MKNKYTYRRIEIDSDSICLIPYKGDYEEITRLDIKGGNIPITELSAEKIIISKIRLSQLHPELKINANSVYFDDIKADVNDINLTDAKFVNFSFSNIESIKYMNISTQKGDSIVFQGENSPRFLVLPGWHKVHFTNPSVPHTMVVDQGAIVSGANLHKTRISKINNLSSNHVDVAFINKLIHEKSNG